MLLVYVSQTVSEISAVTGPIGLIGGFIKDDAGKEIEIYGEGRNGIFYMLMTL